MPKLVTTPNIDRPDDFYAALLSLHEGRGKDQHGQQQGMDTGAAGVEHSGSADDAHHVRAVFHPAELAGEILQRRGVQVRRE